MKDIFAYIRSYAKTLDKRIFLFCSLQTALLIYLNFHFGLEEWLASANFLPWPAFTGHYLIFLFAFGFPYLLMMAIAKKTFFCNRAFVFLLLIAPAIFALKMSLNTELHFSNIPDWNYYWNQVYYWPVRFLVMLAILLLIWWKFSDDQPFYGVTTSSPLLVKTTINWKPYFIMLAVMLPVIALASTRPDFLAYYPKLHNVIPLSEHLHLSWWHALLFELSYGSDFLSIEIFFRGFLVLAFLKWAGRDAILPMACFYCTIHFGKPLGECISSYFGGLLLGIVVYNTRTIYGGLIVHLGIAWMMELGGWAGRSLGV